MKFLEKFVENHQNKFWKKYRLSMDLTAAYLISNFVFIVTFLIIICALNPRSLVFLGQLVPSQYYNYVPWGIIITLFHGYISMGAALNQSLDVLFIFVNEFNISFVFLKELRLGLPETRYRTTECLRSAENLRQVYRSLQILNENWNTFCGPFMWMSNIILVIIPALWTLMLVRFWENLEIVSKVPIMLGIILVIGVWMCVLQCGKLRWLIGGKVLKSWKLHNWTNRREHAIMKRFMKSCKPILINWGKKLVLGRMNQFLYVNGVLRLFLKLSLTIKQ